MIFKFVLGRNADIPSRAAQFVRKKPRWAASSLACLTFLGAARANAQESEAPTGVLQPGSASPDAAPSRDSKDATARDGQKANDPSARAPTPSGSPSEKSESTSGTATAPPANGAPPSEGAPPDAASSDAAPKPESAAEISVVGTRVGKTAGSAHVVRKRDLEQFQYDDPTAALRSVPGVYSRGEDGMGLRPNIGIRGVNPDRSKKLTIMEDGVLVAPATYSAPAAYYFPLMQRIERIFVIKGPGAISYGPQTVGGAINLMTRGIPTAASGMVDLAAGQYGYNKLHGYFGASDETTGFLAEAAHLGTDGFKELPSGADTGFYRNEAMFKARYVLDPRSRAPSEFLFKFTYSDEVSNETYLGLTDADFRATPLKRYGASKLDRMQNFRTGVSLTHTIEPARKLIITTTAYRNDFHRVWRKVNGFRGADLLSVLRNPEDARNAVFAAVISGKADSSSAAETLLIGPNQRDFVSQGIQSVVRWDVDSGPISHRLEYGMRLHQDRVERRHSEDPFRVISGELVPEGGPTIVTAFNEASTEALALHAADAMTWKRLTFTPGIRFEAMRSAFIDRSAKTEERALTNVFLPGAGLFYSITDVLGVFGGAYRGFSPPAPGSPGVKPEVSINYEGGARWYDRMLRLEAIGFYNDYENITDVCTFSSGCTQQNVDRQYDGGKARIYGVESFAQLAPTVGELTVPFTASYTFTRAEFLSTFRSEDPIFGDVTEGDELPYVPRHQMYASIGVESRYGGGAFGATYVSAMREEAGKEPLANTLATDEQLLFDLSANVRVWKPLMAYVNVRNLFDEQAIAAHRPFGARPIAPRWVQVGVKATF